MTIGIIMIANTTPAMNGDLVKNLGSTSKKGIKPKYLLINFAQYSALGIRTNNPQKPKRIDGKAAIKSITDIKKFLIELGA